MYLILILDLSLLDLIHLVPVPSLACLCSLTGEFRDFNEWAHVLVHGLQLALESAYFPVLLRENGLSLQQCRLLLRQLLVERVKQVQVILDLPGEPLVQMDQRVRWELQLRVLVACCWWWGYWVCQCVRLHMCMSSPTLLSRRNISLLISIGVGYLIASNCACQTRYWSNHSCRSVVVVTCMVEMASSGSGQDVISIFTSSDFFLSHHPSMIEGFDLSLHLFEHFLLFSIYHLLLFKHFLSSS